MSVRLVVRTFSELCLTVGALIILCVVYVLFRTGVKAADTPGSRPDDVPGRKTVRDAPCTPLFDGPGRCPTLTICDPGRGGSHRLIVRALPDRMVPVTDGGPEAFRG